MEGLEKFREAFEAYSENYVIIGGTACDIAMTGTAVRPRAPHDIDMLQTPLACKKKKKSMQITRQLLPAPCRPSSHASPRAPCSTPVYPQIQTLLV